MIPRTRRQLRRPSRRLADGAIVFPHVVAIVAALAAAGCGGDEPGEVATAAAPLVALVEPIELQRSYTVPRSYLGTVEPQRQTDASFDLAGRIDLVAIEEGDTVDRGDRIASVDVERLQAQRSSVAAQRDAAVALLSELKAGPRSEAIQAARARVTQREAELDLARITTDRQSRLTERGAASGQRADEAAFEAVALKAAVAAAKAELEELETGTRPEKIEAQRAQVAQLEAELTRIDVELTKSVLLAPFDSVVTRRLVDEGATVTAGQPVVTLIERGRWQVRVGVPAEVARELSVGQSLNCRVRGSVLSGTLVRLRPDRLDATRTVPAIVAFRADAVEDEEPTTADGAAADAMPLFAGDLARVEFERTIEEDGFWLPIEALVEGMRGLWACYVPEPLATDSEATHTLQRIPLELLYSDESQAFVRGPIRDRDLVVVAGIHRLVPGQRVTIRPTQTVAGDAAK